MLNTELLKNQIETSVREAMTKAMLESFNWQGKSTTPEALAEKFGKYAGECADGIASAVESYLKSVTILLPSGTIIPTAPGLICPMGPVTGSLVTFGPVIIENSIK